MVTSQQSISDRKKRTGRPAGEEELAVEPSEALEASCDVPLLLRAA